MPIPVILHTDIGSDVDDTWALVMLLRCPELDLQLVFTDTADTVYRAKLTAKLLTIAERTDVPIAIGLRGEPANELQAAWMEDYALETYAGTIYEDGVQAFIDLVRQSPDMVTVISISPAPSLAEAIRRAPDLAAKCRFVGMFGSVDRGYDDDSPPVAETNVREAVAAARVVLAAPWHDAIITPLDTCGQAILSGALYQQIATAHDPLLQALIENYRVWAALVPWVEVDFVAWRSSILFDTVAVYLAYSRDHVMVELMRLHITDDGMTVRADDGACHLEVALHWRDLNAFLEHLTARLLGA